MHEIVRWRFFGEIDDYDDHYSDDDDDDNDEEGNEDNFKAGLSDSEKHT